MNMLKTNTKVYLIMAIAIAVLANEFEVTQAMVPVNHILSRIRHQKQQKGGARAMFNSNSQLAQKRSHEMTLDDTNLCILACAECSPDDLGSDEHDSNSLPRSVECANECLESRSVKDIVSALLGRKDTFDKKFIKCFLNNLINQDMD